MAVAFVESKSPDMRRVADLLERCRAENRWANRGPLYQRLAEAYAEHLSLPAGRAATPCANGGVALEAMARLLEQRAGRRLRWIGSAFSFQNLGRGHFADMRLLDCDASGRLDLEAVAALDPASWDGMVVVNPFGLFRDFSGYIALARRTGKAMLIDNAAGLDRTIPDWPWQAFSLHHTKPYGAGEGGLAVTPSEAAEPLYALLDYGAAPADPAAWLNNGKLSDIACAFHLDRLERVDDWAPRYREQAGRVARIAAQAGLEPIRPVGDAAPATSWAYLSPSPVPYARVRAARRLTLAKYYKPLAERPRTRRLHDRLVNIPTHPDVAQLSDAELAAELDGLAAAPRMQGAG
jgi:dTDP-4-amino-4,6-dideoxygalactose transaminase